MSGIPAGAGSLLGKRLGKYEILALLALGGTAEIYLARIGGAAGFEKYVVVKCLHDHLADDAEFVKMFLDEARLAAHLDHSNIVQTMELGEHEHRFFMVMEFLAGLSLAMMVRRASERLPGGRIPVPLVLNIVAQACAGLHYAHERVVNGKPLNIVHRDISPQNLVVSFEGVVKLVDFGIAKAELRETRTQSGTIKGKFAYMSPEQCVATNVDRRTDVFALGVIAHELLTGRRLFKKPSPYETYQAVIECAVEPPSRIDPSLDPALDPLIMRAVAKDKERRYSTAEELGDALLGYLHQRGISSGPADVSRFFDSAFGQEIEEHGARMRELISGRAAADPSATWGDGDDDAKQAVDASGQIGADQPGAESSLSSVLGDLDGPQSGEAGDEDMPAERTRIEENPLERLDEMNAEAARQPSRQQPAVRPPSGPQPVARPPAGRPPGGSQMPSIPSGPLTTPPPGRVGATPPPVRVLGPKSGKFSEAAANLPTMIAQPDDGGDEQPDLDAPDLAQTELIPGAGSPLDPLAGLGPSGPPKPPGPPMSAQSDPSAHTMLEMAAPNIDQMRASMGLPPRPDQGPGPGQPPHPSPPQQQLDPHGPGGPPFGPSGPQQMPMMDGQALQGPPGAPGMQPNGSPSPHMPPPRPSMPPLGPTGYPVLSTQLREQVASGATVFPSDLGSGQHDSHRSADTGPGGHGPGAMDWAGGPHAPTRAIPPWMLAVLFIGALGGALLITILIAHAIR